MKVESIKPTDNSIIITLNHNNHPFGIVENIKVDGGFVSSITDYYEHHTEQSDMAIVSFKVNISIYTGLLNLQSHHFMTECHKLVITPTNIQSWVDGIQTRNIPNTLLGNN